MVACVTHATCRGPGVPALHSFATWHLLVAIDVLRAKVAFMPPWLGAVDPSSDHVAGVTVANNISNRY